MASIREAIEAICDEICQDLFTDRLEQRARAIMGLAQAEATLLAPEPRPITWQEAAEVLKDFCASRAASDCRTCPLREWCSDETDLSTLYWEESD